MRAAEAVLVHRGCSSAQVEYFLCAPQRSPIDAEPDDPGGGGGGGAAVRYSARLQGWYRDRLGYRTVHRRGIGYRMRGYPATVPFTFEVGHKLLPGDGDGGADEKSGGASGAAAYEHRLLQLRGRERALERARSALARVTAVSHSCACIGSPCLRQCVHGASILM
eukprot:COSAG01_NODE_751_length_13837_cov_78.727981_12_plen_165_part_00